MKKKSIYSVLLCALLLCLPAGALAAEGGVATDYTLPAAGMTITLPDEMFVFTQDSLDEQLAQFGMTREAWLEYCEANGLCVEAVLPDAAGELLIFVSEDSSGLRDMNRASEKEILEICKSGAVNGEAAEKIGVTYDNAPEICNTEQARFVRMNFTGEQDGVRVHGRQYYTIYNGKVISITMRSYAGAVTDEMAAMQDAALASVRFDTEPDRSPIRSGGLGGAVLPGVLGGAFSAAIVFVVVWGGHQRKKKKREQEAIAAAAFAQPEATAEAPQDGTDAAGGGDPQGGAK